jgi:hypothetical protein
MRMLDHGHTQALRVEMRDQPRQQRGLARTAPACKADDFHSGSLFRNQRSPMEPQSPPRHCEERSDEAIQTATVEILWIASLRSQ